MLEAEVKQEELNLVKNIDELENEAKKMMGKVLVTHQTGPEGKKLKDFILKKLQIFLKNFIYLVLVDRETSKIAFISSTEGGMDIEKVASETPKKIITNKIDLKDEGPSQKEIENIISYLNLMIKKKCIKIN